MFVKKELRRWIVVFLVLALIAVCISAWSESNSIFADTPVFQVATAIWLVVVLAIIAYLTKVNGDEEKYKDALRKEMDGLVEKLGNRARHMLGFSGDDVAWSNAVMLSVNGAKTRNFLKHTNPRLAIDLAQALEALNWANRLGNAMASGDLSRSSLLDIVSLLGIAEAILAQWSKSEEGIWTHRKDGVKVAPRRPEAGVAPI
jgi:hypothetical protein